MPSSFAASIINLARRHAPLAKRSSIVSLQVFCLIHLINEHLIEVRACTGASMLPTLSPSGDLVVHLRLPFHKFLSNSKTRLDSLLGFGSGDEADVVRHPYRGFKGTKVGGTSLKADQSQGTSLRVGDLVVAISPIDPSRTVCKRVIGLPGDTICVDPRFRPIDERYWRGRSEIANPTSPSSSSSSSTTTPPTLLEDDRGSSADGNHGLGLDSSDEIDKLLDSMDLDSSSHPPSAMISSLLSREIEKAKTSASRKGQVEYVTIPPGHVWLTGDNLSNSTDSRHYGPVPMGMVRGKVIARLFPNPLWLDNNVKDVQ
ncbi:LexA/Signal peptidase [Violaceomyces palustris]|uniref:LexA/Signal peptidase n=1 Tax=Violaceomyces palustris TaxID=1673888 RepID=A0ACD0P7P2_9BASI|nr:LexA/Signal peptidase [Violaceomyces palustris]